MSPDSVVPAASNQERAERKDAARPPATSKEHKPVDAIFARTGGADFPDRLKVMISGPPKSGKTSLLGTVPNIVIADTEPHANNLQSIAHLNVPYSTVNHTDALHRLRFVLADPSLRAKAAEQMGMPSIDAVAIDTLDTLQQILKAERLKETRQSQFLRDDWAWLKEEMTTIIRAFTALPLHVFFTVHTKTSELGKGDDARTIVLPGLQGAIAEEIAGMVGYSLYAFRKQEIRADGSPYTKYWLRTEGDETFGYLGNRAAGRLPDVVEPSFQAIYSAAMAGRPAPAPAPVQLDLPPAATQPPAAEVVQISGHPVSTPAQTAPAPAPVSPPGGEEPINATALTHVQRVYTAISATFPEDVIRAISIGQARSLVKMWQACQADEIEGKSTDGLSAADEMTHYLADQGWLAPADAQRVAQERAARTTPAPAAVPAPEPAQPVAEPVVETVEPIAVAPVVEPEPVMPDPMPEPGALAEPEGVEPAEVELPAVVPDPNGTIEQVLAWVESGPQERVQQAYDVEIAKVKPRQTLLVHLAGRGAVPPPPAPVADAPAPLPPAAPTEEQATATVESTLGAQLLDEQSDDGQPAPCEECGKPVDDTDIAVLSRTRFKRWLCVSDYIAQTKKPIPA